jgi:hypothetical protein
LGFFLYLYEMKAKEFIYNLRTNLEEAGSQLRSATDQHIMFMLDEARAIYAGQKMDRAFSLTQMAQVIDVTPTIAPTSEVGTVGNARILKVEIPQPVVYMNGDGIFTVGATDGQDSYTRIDFSQLRTALSRKYTGNTPKWFWLGSSMYIINAEIDSLSKVRIRGIFSEPYKVEIAMNRYKYLDPFNWEYPLSLKDAKAVYQLAMSGDLGWGDTAVQAIQNAEAKSKRGQQLLGALQSNASNQQDA